MIAETLAAAIAVSAATLAVTIAASAVVGGFVLSGKRPIERGDSVATFVIDHKGKVLRPEKKCTHEHAIKGTCLTCGEENV